MKSLDLTSLPNTNFGNDDVSEHSASGANDDRSNINSSENQMDRGE